MNKRQISNTGNMTSEGLVKGLFLDYDGTISPLNVPRSKSAVSSRNMSVLHKIRKKIPVAMITTKDLSFVVKRTSFAHAWSASGGLETKIGSKIIRASCLGRKLRYLKTALDYAKTLSQRELTIEEKRDSKGNTIAFSVDWRQSIERRKAIRVASKLISYCETLPIATLKYEGQPFFDVFPCPVDKGKALRKLKQELGLCNGVLYMGDSLVDNAAFQAANFAVGVIHEETSSILNCDYFVEFEDVPSFLQDLLIHDLRFSSKMSMILNRSEALRFISEKNRA